MQRKRCACCGRKFKPISKVHMYCRNACRGVALRIRQENGIQVLPKRNTREIVGAPGKSFSLSDGLETFRHKDFTAMPAGGNVPLLERSPDGNMHCPACGGLNIYPTHKQSGDYVVVECRDCKHRLKQPKSFLDGDLSRRKT